MNRHHIGLTLVSIWSITAFAQPVRSPSYLEGKSQVAEKIANRTFVKPIVKKRVMDLQIAREEADNIFSGNPVAAGKAKAAYRISENDEEYVFLSETIEYKLSKRSHAEHLMDLARYTVAEPTLCIDDDTAHAIAKSYVKRYLKQLPMGLLRHVRTAKLMDAVCRLGKSGNPEGETITQIANFEVTFERSINGVEVFGPGGKLHVYLARNGDVIGHSFILREIEETMSTPSMRPKPYPEIEDRLLSILSRSATDNTELLGVRLGYLERSRKTKQGEIPLAYMVEYSYGPHSKRLVNYYDAVTGLVLDPAANTGMGDSR